MFVLYNNDKNEFGKRMIQRYKNHCLLAFFVGIDPKEIASACCSSGLLLTSFLGDFLDYLIFQGFIFCGFKIISKAASLSCYFGDKMEIYLISSRELSIEDYNNPVEIESYSAEIFDSC